MHMYIYRYILCICIYIYDSFIYIIHSYTLFNNDDSFTARRKPMLNSAKLTRRKGQAGRQAGRQAPPTSSTFRLFDSSTYKTFHQAVCGMAVCSAPLLASWCGRAPPAPRCNNPMVSCSSERPRRRMRCGGPTDTHAKRSCACEHPTNSQIKTYFKSDDRLPGTAGHCPLLQ